MSLQKDLCWVKKFVTYLLSLKTNLLVVFCIKRWSQKILENKNLIIFQTFLFLPQLSVGTKFLFSEIEFPNLKFDFMQINCIKSYFLIIEIF